MTNHSHGHYAEQVAAEYLRSAGYDVMAINWKHAAAEIDIVACKHARFRTHNQTIIFFEVKYRESDWQGHGLDYITPKKLAQMQFAAELYVSIENYDGAYTLGAIELSGKDFQITNVLIDL